MSRYDDGSGYIADSEQEADCSDEEVTAYALAFLVPSDGGMKVERFGIFGERNPTQSWPGIWCLIAEGYGGSYGAAAKQALAIVNATMPGLRLGDV